MTHPPQDKCVLVCTTLNWYKKITNHIKTSTDAWKNMTKKTQRQQTPALNTINVVQLNSLNVNQKLDVVMNCLEKILNIANYTLSLMAGI